MKHALSTNSASPVDAIAAGGTVISFLAHARRRDTARAAAASLPEREDHADWALVRDMILNASRSDAVHIAR